MKKCYLLITISCFLAWSNNMLFAQEQNADSWKNTEISQLFLLTSPSQIENSLSVYFNSTQPEYDDSQDSFYIFIAENKPLDLKSIEKNGVQYISSRAISAEGIGKEYKVGEKRQHSTVIFPNDAPYGYTFKIGTTYYVGVAPGRRPKDNKPTAGDYVAEVAVKNQVSVLYTKEFQDTQKYDANNLPDLTVTKIDCSQLAWEDPNNPFKDTYILNKINGITYAYSSKEEFDYVGEFIKSCYITVKNIGGDIHLFSQVNSTKVTDTLLNSNPAVGTIGLNLGDTGMKKNEERVVQTTISFRPNYQPENAVHLKIYLNQYLNIESSQRGQYKADKFYSDLRKINNLDEINNGKINSVPEANYENNTAEAVINFAAIPYPAQVQDVHFSLVNQNVALNWGKAEKSDSYKIDITYGLGEGSGTKTESFNTTATSFVVPISATDKPISAHVVGINSYGEGHLSKDMESSEMYYPNQQTFKDVASNVWFKPYVAYAFYRGAINGYKDKNGNLLGLYGPNDPVTVAELAQIFTKSVGAAIPQETDVIADKYKSHWAANLLNWLIKNNYHLVKYDQNPNRPATRADVVRFYLEFAQFDQPNSDFNKYIQSDEASKQLSFVFPDIKNHESKNYIQIAYDFMLIDGYPDGTFRPYDLVNRAEMAKIFTNALKDKVRK